MKNAVLAVVLSSLVSAMGVMASVSGNSFWYNGYVTIGRTVVVLPQRLVAGDRIDFFNIYGQKVFEKKVHSGYLSADVSGIPAGRYSMVVYRNGAVIASRGIVLAGGERN